MKPIGETYGIDLRVLDGARIETTTPQCPGAKLRVTRKDLATMKEGGERFWDNKKADPIPVDGYGDARVFCTNQVQVGDRGCDGTPVVYGICSSCHGLEEDNRATLRERQKVREGQTR